MDIKRYKHKIGFLILVISLVLICYLGKYFHIDIQGIQDSLSKVPRVYSGVVFVILYCILTFVIWFSKDVFKFAGALFFGAGLSSLFILIAEVINCLILFNLSRYLGRNFVEESLKGKYKRLDEKMGRMNFVWLLLFRAAPLIPFRFLDLASGLTRISFKKYLVAAILGSPLRIFWVQYILAGVGKAVFNNPYALIEYLLANKVLFIFSLMYLILIIFVAFKIKAKD